jgi:hypothetical protein
MAYRTKILPAALYKLQYSSETLSELREMCSPSHSFLRRSMQLIKTHPEDLLYASAKEAGLGLPNIVDQIQWRKLGILQRVVQRQMPSQKAGNALLEREFSREAVPTSDQQATLSQCPRSGSWLSSLREFLHKDGVYLQFNNLQGAEQDDAERSLLNYAQGDGAALAEELARRDIFNLRDISAPCDLEQQVRTIRDTSVTHYLVGLPRFVSNTPYSLRQGMMFLHTSDRTQELIEFRGVFWRGIQPLFFFQLLERRTAGVAHNVGSQYVRSEDGTMVLDASEVTRLNMRVLVRSSAAAARISA